MEQIKIPDGYHSDLNLHDTQVAIKTVKDFFPADTFPEAESSPCFCSYLCISILRSERQS